MGCGTWCVYYTSRGKSSACLSCSYYIEERRSRFELGKVDPFKLARLLKEKEEKEKQGKKETKNTKNEVILEICPQCGERSYWFNPYTNKHECMNKKSCPTHGMSNFLTDYFRHNHSSDYQSEYIHNSQAKLSNPLLLSVKMFLADVIYMINRKYEEGHVCADFAQEVSNAATERDIRCGYVVIHFAETNIAHAIVAFETDYGLKYFEPQSANEEDVIVGRPYSAYLKGVPQGNIITKIEITWNDGMTTTLD